MAEKENRCWPGYEPVKGKAPHTQGSCRPKAESKTTPPQKKVRAARRKQLDQWEAEHPGTRKSASQNLRAPNESGAKTKKKAAGKKKTEATSAKRTPPKKKAAKQAASKHAPSARKRTIATGRKRATRKAA